MIDCIVVGAGLAGAVMAERLASQLNKKVLVIEKRRHIGGNCYDYKDVNDILVHKYGPHLFHTNNKAVFTYLSKFTEWDVYQHKVLAMVDGQKVAIPFNLNTLYDLFPNNLAKTLEEKLLLHYPFNSKVPILELKKSIDEDLQFLADYIYEKVFVHYTAKQWGMKPEEMDSAVTARVPVFIGKDDRYFNDEYQTVPKKGYTKLFENMLNHPNIKLLLNTDFNEFCSIDDNKIFLLGQVFEGLVVYTGQIDELFGYSLGELPYRSVAMKFESLDQDLYQESTTINYPNNYDFTRITEFKHIHSVKSNKTTILKEYPQQYVRNQNTPYYPIFTDENILIYDKYKQSANELKNLLLLGRLAEYKYYDMDDMVEQALKAFEEVKSGNQTIKFDD
jgi:UDP-galactopyranose mutase